MHKSPRASAPVTALLAFLLGLAVPSVAVAQFTAITKGPLGHDGSGFGVAWGDFNGDGDPDLYITNDGPNRLLRNNGDGTFSRITGLAIENGGPGQGVAWGDNHGDLDLYVAKYGTPNKLIRNEGGNPFNTCQRVR